MKERERKKLGNESKEKVRFRSCGWMLGGVMHGISTCACQCVGFRKVYLCLRGL